MIETINKLVRTVTSDSCTKIGREPTPEEMAEPVCQMPLEKVRKVMKIAKEPISLEDTNRR